MNIPKLPPEITSAFDEYVAKAITDLSPEDCRKVLRGMIALYTLMTGLAPSLLILMPVLMAPGNCKCKDTVAAWEFHNQLVLNTPQHLNQSVLEEFAKANR